MTMRKWAVRAAPALALPAIMIAAGEASAGGFGLREQSAYYQGTSFAGDAAGGAGLASMFWNPAALSFAPGLSVEGNVTYIAPHASVDVFSATAPLTGASLGNLGVGDIVDNGTLPTSYMTYAGERWSVGLAVTSPYGLVTDAPCNWSGRYYGCYSRIFDMNVQGSFAYKVTDWLTLGAGVNVNYIDARLSNAQFTGFAPPANNLYAQVDGDDIGYGFNLGALVTLAPGTTVGIGYRSSISQDLGGTLGISLANIVPLNKLHATAALTLPDQVTASFRSQLDPSWTILGTVEWTNWSTVQQLVVKSRGVPVSTLDLQWNDGWFFSGGVEYQWDPKLALRAGLAYELTPVPDSTRSPRLPDTNRLWLSAGLTYNFTPQFSVDFAYSHIFGENSPITLSPADPSNALRGTLIAEVNDGYVDIVSVGLRYKFDSPAGTALAMK
ncbi:outer membrane protein transport protein [Xanthobacter dioxanivorans]|uniref:Outer membrane protein transport protein n=1 Tax=Xanthobacter dioxanivorans TaxID=2528964 RepID=A0A974PLB0_9HYPH|nr:outer membrane protein transport protein [Xanthobacter dioxanivorans]QRG05120.1 outer membrane protein transport protein [Xanthobacter dioxanivorans]